MKNSDHIDSNRVRQNVYWDCYQGFYRPQNNEEEQSMGARFELVEKAFYLDRYYDFCEAQNERNRKTGHSERNRDKGIIALILKNHARDFISGAEMDFSTYSNAKIDIHHIFPKDHCIGQKYDKAKWNCIVNKTPISASSNREIGGVAPSVYLGKLEKKGAVSSSDLDVYVETHWIDHTLLRNNEFQDFIIDRARKLLAAIEAATGRTISGKDSDEVQQAFGAAL